VITTYNKRLKKSIDKKKVQQDWFINADEALKIGLVDEVI
jgi:ATP-dependent protease ClpP protease subunit